MISAVLDTNVIVQSLISSTRAASSRSLDAYFNRRFQLIYSPSLLDELLNVLLVPHIRARHRLTDDEILEFVTSLLPYGREGDDSGHVSPSVTHDATDTKFLALAQAAHADYLVTNDRRHLLRLKRYHSTKIVTPAQFLHELP